MFNRDRDKTYTLKFIVRRHSGVACHGNTIMDRPANETAEKTRTTNSLDDFPIVEVEKRSLRTEFFPRNYTRVSHCWRNEPISKNR